MKFYASSFAGTVSVVDGGDVVLALRKSDPRGPGKVTTLVESWVGGRRTEIRGEERAPTVVNVFKGNDPARWQTNVPTYDRVSLGEVYDGIELKLQSRGRTVEKLFYVRPGAEPASIRVKVAGASRLAAAETGELEVETGMGEVRFSAPVAYQESSGTRQPVEVAYVVRGDEYGFRLGSYDRGRELVIDPILNSTFVGGASADSALAIAVDILGGVYVGGGTASPDFPGMGPDSIDPTFGTGTQGFFVQLDTNLNVILTATFLSGSGSVNEVRGIAVPSIGGPSVVGVTNSPDFPGIDSNSPDPIATGLEGFVVTLIPSPNNHTVFGTFLGGSGSDEANAVAVDDLGVESKVYVAGSTDSADFPGIRRRSHDSSLVGREAFVVQLDKGLHEIEEATFLGGSGVDEARAITASGWVYVAGQTSSPDFPGVDSTSADHTFGCAEGFVVALTQHGLIHIGSTFLGGQGCQDAVLAIAADNYGVYAAGVTDSPDFPGVGLQSAVHVFARRPRRVRREAERRSDCRSEGDLSRRQPG